MNLVILVIKNDKVAQTIIGACRDRGAQTLRLDGLEAALKRLEAPSQPGQAGPGPAGPGQSGQDRSAQDEFGPDESGHDESGFGTLVIDLAEFNTKSEKKINQALADLSKKVQVLGLGSNFDLKSVTSFFRSGLSDYLNLPLDPIELTRSLNKVLGNLAQSPSKAPQTKNPGDRPTDPAKAPRGAIRPVKTAIGARAVVSQNAPQTLNPSAPLPRDGENHFFFSIVGQDPGLMEIFRIVEKVAATDSTVMVHGESGTGKELIARAIHQASPRKNRPMIPVNCGAIPEELLETELFGHEKGAFTNAIRDRVGRFEMADGGTIFLDEIGDMSPKLQVKLLRVIQEHEFERVGGDKTISVDIRIITATHVDLTRAVRDGRFREDLYYRLNVIPLTIPPLRDRSGDVPLLIDYFLARLRETRGSKVTSLTDEVKSILMAYRWPGNVRELENLMERMVILADGPVLTKSDLPVRLIQDVESRGPTPPQAAPSQPLSPAQGSPASPACWAAPAPPLPVSPSGPLAQEDQGQPEPGPTPEEPGYPEPDDDQASGPDFSKLSQVLNLDPSEEPEAQITALEENSPAYGSLVEVKLDQELVCLVEPILRFPESGVDLSSVMNRFEDRLIRSALKANHGVKNHAAKALGLNRTTFLEKLKKKGIE